MSDADGGRFKAKTDIEQNFKSAMANKLPLIF